MELICELCKSEGDLLDLVAYVDPVGNLKGVHHSCMDSGLITSRLLSLLYPSNPYDQRLCDQMNISKMRLSDILTALVGGGKIWLSGEGKKKPDMRSYGFVEIPENLEEYKTFGEWFVTKDTWKKYVDAVRKMRSLYDPDSLRNKHNDLPPDPKAQLAQFNKRVALHKKLFKEADVPYHANKNATHASRKLGQLMSDRLEVELK